MWLSIVWVWRGRLPQASLFVERPAWVRIWRDEGINILSVCVPDARKVFAQRSPALRVYATNRVVAGLNPFAWTRIDERVEELRFRNDDLNDDAVDNFCVVAHVMYVPEVVNVWMVYPPLDVTVPPVPR